MQKTTDSTNTQIWPPHYHKKNFTNNFILHQIGSWNTQNLNATSLWGRASGLVTFYVELNSMQHTIKRYLCESRIINQNLWLQLVSENRSGLIRLRLASLSLAPGPPFLFSLFNIIDISLTMVFTTTTININTIILNIITIIITVTRNVQQQTAKTMFPPHLVFRTKSCSIGIEDDDEFGKRLAALLRTRFDAVITRVHCQL